MSIKFINKSGGKAKLLNGSKFRASTFITFDLGDFDISELISFEELLYGCNSLATVNFTNINTINITSMANMFNSCTALTSLNLSNFDTSKVTNMANMFYKCNSLTSLNLSGFDTSKVTNMGSMFANCPLLTSLDLSDFDTSNVTGGLSYFFSGCSNLVDVDISHFNLSKITSNNNPFDSIVAGCTSLSNNSMNSILKAMSTSNKPSASSYKRLSRCGFTQEQAEICTTLSNWSLLSAKGWTTGY